MRTKVVDETIKIDKNGFAKCYQQTTYLNTNNKPLKFPGPLQLHFHKDCNDFTFTKVSESLSCSIIDVKDEPYQKSLKYIIIGTIEPNTKTSFCIEYSWPLFLDNNEFKQITTDFDTLTDYNLTIEVEDDLFTGHLISIYDGENILERERNYLVTDTGNLVIMRQHLNRNSRIDLQIIAKIKKIELAAITEISDKYKKCIPENIIVINILHLLRDSIPFFYALNMMGFKKSDTHIIGIPYSSKVEVVKYLSSEGFNVRTLDRHEYNLKFYDLVRDELHKVISKCKKQSKKFAIIEDGGYAVPLMHSEYNKELSLCIGAVEQTKNGIWEDRELEEAGKLGYPIISVAESKIKEERESPLVGIAICQNIISLLKELGQGLMSMEVGQIGYGNIGAPLAKEIVKSGADLTIYDKDEVQREQARLDNLKVVDSLENILPGKKLIVGCTGDEWFGPKQYKKLDRNIFYVNATSKGSVKSSMKK